MGKRRIKKNRNYSRNASATATFSMAMVLFLIGLLVLTTLFVRDMTTYVKENLKLTLVLKDDVSEQQKNEIQKYLTGQIYTKSAEYISKEKALQEHIKYLGDDPQAFLGYNPLSAVIEVSLQANYAQSDSVAKIESELKKYDSAIEEVNYPKDVMAAVNDNIRNISFVLTGLAIVLLLVSFVLINNTLRLRIYSNRFIINTMKLVGAKSWFIRKPYILQSVWSGFVAALLAMLLLGGLLFYMHYHFGLSTQLISWQMAAIVGAVILFSGIFLTAFLAYLAVGRYIRMQTNDMYYA